MKITTATSIYGKIGCPGELPEILSEAIERAVPTVGDVIIYPYEVPGRIAG